MGSWIPTSFQKEAKEAKLKQRHQEQDKAANRRAQIAEMRMGSREVMDLRTKEKEARATKERASSWARATFGQLGSLAKETAVYFGTHTSASLGSIQNNTKRPASWKIR